MPDARTGPPQQQHREATGLWHQHPQQWEQQVEDDDVSQHQDHVTARNMALQQRQHLELVANLHERERAAQAAETQ